ncbi:MAG: hypothetical protein ACRD5M_07405 [Candidatus Acidiferrales bacterium]
MNDRNKPQIYFQVFESAEFADFNYWLEVIFSIGIATLGLIISSPAVVIGAMLILLTFWSSSRIPCSNR